MPNNLSSILKQNGSDLALLLGNGVNRHGSRAPHNSWDHLLHKVAADCAPPLKAAPAGISLTEFFDVLELKSGAGKSALQAEFCALLKEWTPGAHHMRLMRWARIHDAPVLTTNFDDVLATAGDCKFQRF